MPIVNRKIGNGFVFNAVDSTKDQEHYFYGKPKFVDLKLKGDPIVSALAGTTVLTTGTIFNWIDYDPYRNVLFTCGHHTTTSPVSGAVDTWWVLSSSDNGTTWGVTDEYMGPAQSSGSANCVFVDLSGTVWVAGYHVVTGSEGMNGLVRKMSASNPSSWETFYNYSSASDSEDVFFTIGGAQWGSWIQGGQYYTWVAGYSTRWGATPENIVFSRYDTTSFGGANDFFPYQWFSGSSTADTRNRARDMAFVRNPSNGRYESLVWCGIWTTTGSIGSNAFTYLYPYTLQAHDNFNDGANNDDEAHGFHVFEAYVLNLNNTIPSNREVIYVAGVMSASNGKHAFVRKIVYPTIGTVIYNAAYKTIDDYMFSGSTANETVANWVWSNQSVNVAAQFAGQSPTTRGAGVGPVSASVLYSGGYYKKDNTSKKYWYIRRSIDELDRRLDIESTSSWATAEEISIGNNNEAKRAVVDISGNMYVCGQINNQGVVRKYTLPSQTASYNDQFSLPFVGETPLKQRVFDKNNVDLTDKLLFLSSAFGLSYATGSRNELFAPVFTFRVSSSFGALDFNANENVSIKFIDGRSNDFKFARKINILGSYYDEGGGWWRFESNLFSGSTQLIPVIAVHSGSVNFLLSGTFNGGVIKDIELKWTAPLSNAGVSSYKEIDNTNNDDIISNLGLEALKKVE